MTLLFIMSTVTMIVEAFLDIFPLILVLLLPFLHLYSVFLFLGNSLSPRGMQHLSSGRLRVLEPVPVTCC